MRNSQNLQDENKKIQISNDKNMFSIGFNPPGT